MIARPSSISREKSLLLDIVRFGAACLVLLHHVAFAKFGTFVPWRFSQTATEPVMLFFVLSGFVIALTAEVNDKSPGQYAVNRAARLLSVTLPALVLTLALDHIGRVIFPALYADHASDVATLLNLTTPVAIQISATATLLNQVWDANVWPGTNSPFWSLGYEAAYYTIFGIGFYVRRLWPRAVGVMLACLVVGPKILLLFPVWLIGVAAWHVSKRMPISPLMGAALCITSGVAYAMFVTSDIRSALDLRTDMLTAGLPPNLIGLSKHFLSNYVSGLAFAGALVGLKGLEGTFAPVLSACSAQIRGAARCTFSMYLYHYPLIYFFRAIAAAMWGNRDLSARSWPATMTVLISTGISIYILARVTEQRKAEARSVIMGVLSGLRPPPVDLAAGLAAAAEAALPVQEANVEVVK